MTGALGPGPQTRLRRMSSRAHYDRPTIYGILDEALVCHIGLSSGVSTAVLPTAFGRDGDVLYLHGAPANATLRSALAQGRICVTVTLVDAVVLARSAFHHSLNYRSVVAFGAASEVVDLSEQRHAADVIVDHLLPGRSREARGPTDDELRATRIVRFDIAEASAKIRTGGPKEESRDLVPGNVWAGIVPLQQVAGEPLVDDQAPVHAPSPRHFDARSGSARH